MYEVFFDIETKNFFDENLTKPSDLSASIVSIFTRKTGHQPDQISGVMMSFWENEFDSMWKYFLEADRIIGFNTLGFDVPVLTKYAPSNWEKLPHFDIMAKIKEITGHRVSLNKVASSTLGSTKIDSGENAIKYWEKGDAESLNQLKKYCEADVQITQEIYDHVLKYNKVKFLDHWNNPREIDLDFSYPTNLNTAVQASLF